MQIGKRQLDDILRRIQERHSAVGKLRDHSGLEQHGQSCRSARRGMRALIIVDVVDEAVHGMQIRDGVAIARIGLRLNREHGRIEVLPVRQLALVERQVGARLDLAARRKPSVVLTMSKPEWPAIRFASSVSLES